MNEKLLLVEESPTLRGILKDILQKGVYALTTVETVEEAKAKLTEDYAHYDVLVLVTEEEPELVEFARKNKKFQCIPVIMFSGEEICKNKVQELKIAFFQRPFPIKNFDIFIREARELAWAFYCTPLKIPSS